MSDTIALIAPYDANGTFLKVGDLVGKTHTKRTLTDGIKLMRVIKTYENNKRIICRYVSSHGLLSPENQFHGNNVTKIPENSKLYDFPDEWLHFLIPTTPVWDLNEFEALLEAAKA